MVLAEKKGRIVGDCQYKKQSPQRCIHPGPFPVIGVDSAGTTEGRDRQTDQDSPQR